MNRTLWVTLLLLVLCPSCFRRFIKTDRQIEKHFANKAVKPQYNTLHRGNRQLHYASVGTDTAKPLLLFVHGAPGAWYGWLGQLDDSLLQRHFRMIAVDRPGYGKSNYGQPVTDQNEQADWLAALLAKEKRRSKTIVVARSYGCPVAMALAAHYPHLVDGLLLVSSVVSPRHEKFYWFSPWGKRKWVQYLLPQALNVATAEKYNHRNELEKIQPLWQQVQQPVVAYQGAKDHLADTANLYWIDSALVNAPHRSVMLASQGHFITYHLPDSIRQAVFELLGRQQP